MNNLNETITNMFHYDPVKLMRDYKETKDTNKTFKNITDNLKLEDKELMKYTTSLEEASCEYDNCQNCKCLQECKNSYKGYLYTPEVLGSNLVFNYIPCKYKLEYEEANKYKQNIYLYEIPKEIKTASMKEIDISDPERFKLIKWLKNFLDNYEINKGLPGLYLCGSFGCGKTYLLSAALNELAKKGHKIAIIYYPEFLRSLKESFGDSEEYNEKFNFIKRRELLLFDDIGAETMTEWSRDEVLGTILQYRMQEGLTTFFTSNLNIKDLEEHFSISSKGIEKVKSKRIIERIKYLTIEMTLVSENRRYKKEGEE